MKEEKERGSVEKEESVLFFRSAVYPGHLGSSNVAIGREVVRASSEMV